MKNTNLEKSHDGNNNYKKQHNLVNSKDEIFELLKLLNYKMETTYNSLLL